MAQLARSAAARASCSSRSHAHALRDIADGRGDEHRVAIANRTQADLNGEFGTIGAQCEELEADAHRAHAARFRIVRRDDRR